MIEILFEDIKLEKATHLLVELCANSVLSNYQVSSDEPEIEMNLQSQVQILRSIEKSSDGSFYFIFSDFKLKGFELSSVGFQIYKYNFSYDLNIHLDEELIPQTVSVTSLQSWAELIAIELNAQTYCCGYEPAADEDTRFFSGKNLGPLGWGNTKG